MQRRKRSGVNFLNDSMKPLLVTHHFCAQLGTDFLTLHSLAPGSKPSVPSRFLG